MIGARSDGVPVVASTRSTDRHRAAAIVLPMLVLGAACANAGNPNAQRHQLTGVVMGSVFSSNSWTPDDLFDVVAQAAKRASTERQPPGSGSV